VAQVDTREPDGGPSDRLPLPDEPARSSEDTPAPTASESPANARQHRVRKGETLWSIAHQYHVSVADLKRWNDLRDEELRVGEELRVQG
jgi:membrane-bound lytic murein transglycosylase D